jgi:acetyl esterase/lipase
MPSQPPASRPSSELERLLDELARLVRERPWPVTMLTYGALADQRAELRLPDGPGPHPVALVLHGGFWRAAYTSSTTEALALALTAAGWATLNVEYRRVGAGGGVPATLDDVRAAAALAASADASLDARRTIAIGHSAGGQLALWLAGELRLAGAVSLGGVCDLRAAARDGLGGGAAVELCGGTPEQRPAAYEAADPLGRLPLGVPQLLVHGVLDDRVPVGQSRSYAAAAHAAGDRCELLELPRCGHFEPIDPRSAAFAALLGRLHALWPSGARAPGQAPR